MPVRLLTASLRTGGHYGLVQIQQSSRFQYVCANGWSQREANIVCRELGFASGNVLNNATAAGLTDVPSVVPRFGEQGIVEGLICSGIEDHLSLCPHWNARSWESVPCSALAAVVCSSEFESLQAN